MVHPAMWKPLPPGSVQGQGILSGSDRGPPVLVGAERAGGAGFDLAGIAARRPTRGAGRFGAWLDAGRHGSMEYLERNRARIEDPRGIRPEGRSLLVVGMGHSRAPVRVEGGARIARYAAGRKAYFEYLPTMEVGLPVDPTCAGDPLFKVFQWGSLVDVIIPD